MKTLKYLILLLMSGLVFSSCSKDEDIVFEHEKPQFEISSESILVEVIVPQGTLSGENIYIVGDFNGGADAIGDSKWRLTVSPNTRHRFGIYLNPAEFVSGIGLANGYSFYASQSGEERNLECEEVVRTESASVGTRLVCEVASWAGLCEEDEPDPDPDPNGIWPEPESGKIMLRLELPDYTPTNATILIYGFINGWDGSDESKWKSVPVSKTKHYFMLDPNDFADGTSLDEEFKFGLMMEGQPWWYHQSNEDGGGEDGAGFFLPGALNGQAYDLEILGWRMSSEIIVDEEPTWPDAPEDKIMLRLLVPDYTPENATILIYGFINGWDGSDETQWATTELMEGKHYIMLDPDLFEDGTSLADQFKFGLMIGEQPWWYHQSNEDGSSEDGAGYSVEDASVGNHYEIEILHWRASDEL